MDRVTNWLEQLGLGQYAQAFAENAIDWTHLPDLDLDCLIDALLDAQELYVDPAERVASIATKRGASSMRVFPMGRFRVCRFC